MAFQRTSPRAILTSVVQTSYYTRPEYYWGFLLARLSVMFCSATSARKFFLTLS